MSTLVSVQAYHVLNLNSRTLTSLDTSEKHYFSVILAFNILAHSFIETIWNQLLYRTEVFDILVWFLKQYFWAKRKCGHNMYKTNFAQIQFRMLHQVKRKAFGLDSQICSREFGWTKIIAKWNVMNPNVNFLLTRI